MDKASSRIQVFQTLVFRTMLFGGRDVTAKPFLYRILSVKKMNYGKTHFIKSTAIIGKTQTQVKETKESKRQCFFYMTPTNGRGGRQKQRS